VPPNGCAFALSRFDVAWSRSRKVRVDC